jgi:transposase-like protein
MNIVQIYKQFPTQQSCIEHLERVRWNNNPTCPYCKTQISITAAPKEKRYHCNYCNMSFSVTVGTIFHKTKCDLQKWFLAISLVLNAKKGYAARQLGRDIEVTKDTAWYMFMRIRKAFVEYPELLNGIVEADETYVGGKNKNRHADKKTEGGQGRGGEDKTVVIGLKQRNGKVIAKKAKDASGKTLKSFINQNVEKNSTISTDEWRGYNGLENRFKRLIVAHGLGQYVDGQAHTNGLENFWSLFKRGFMGQYHQLSDKWLDKYVTEFSFRYNNRLNDLVFDLTIQKAVNL